MLDIRVGEAGFGSLVLAPPWAFAVDPGPYALLYAPIAGRAVLDIAGGERIELTRGSVVSLVGGQAHRLADGTESLRRGRGRRLEFSHLGAPQPLPSPGADTQLLVARVPLSSNPLPEVLSGVIHVAADVQPLAARLHQELRLAITFNTAPESARDPLFKRVAEMLAIELTEHALGERGQGWQTELADPRIERAVGLMRAHPERPWSVATLAAEARMSRSGFAARFRTVVGRTPLAYLRHCRVEAAIALLTTSELPLYAIADRVGYQSESAFTRVFTRATGLSPARYRRQRRRTEAAANAT